MQFQQMVEDAKTPLLMAQTEIDSLKRDLLAARRTELNVSECLSGWSQSVSRRVGGRMRESEWNGERGGGGERKSARRQREKKRE